MQIISQFHDFILCIISALEAREPYTSHHSSRVAAIVRSHHERFDGNGYPDGLAGDEIPFGVRIIAVADSIDAMISDRPYRKGMEEKK